MSKSPSKTDKSVNNEADKAFVAYMKQGYPKRTAQALAKGLNATPKPQKKPK